MDNYFVVKTIETINNLNSAYGSEEVDAVAKRLLDAIAKAEQSITHPSL